MKILTLKVFITFIFPGFYLVVLLYNLSVDVNRKVDTQARFYFSSNGTSDKISGNVKIYSKNIACKDHPAFMRVMYFQYVLPCKSFVLLWKAHLLQKNLFCLQLHHIILEVKYLCSYLPQLIYFNSDAFLAFCGEVSGSAISYVGENVHNNDHGDEVGHEHSWHFFTLFYGWHHRLRLVWSNQGDKDNIHFLLNISDGTFLCTP